MTLRDYLASLVRTVVPYLVGLGLVWLAAHAGVTIPGEPLKTLAAGAAGAGYYSLVRLAEAKWAWVGWLLGYAVAPVYQKPA